MFEKVNAKNDTDFVYDLHTQHVDNAKKLVKEKLEELDDKSGSLKPFDDELTPDHHIICLVCGAGNHSKDGKAILKQAIY